MMKEGNSGDAARLASGEVTSHPDGKKYDQKVNAGRHDQQVFILAPEDFSSMCEKAASPTMRRLIEQDDAIIRHTRQLHKQDFERHPSTAPRISAQEWIRRNPTSVENNKCKLRSSTEKTWVEHTDASTPEERSFCDAARKVGQGNFTEMLQMAFTLADGQIVRGVAYSGGSDISGEAATELLMKLKAQISGSVQSLHVIHNHPDYFAETTLPEDFASERLLERNGLSAEDVEFADQVLEYAAELFDSHLSVHMIAVDEAGFTHSYEGGTSHSVKID